MIYTLIEALPGKKGSSTHGAVLVYAIDTGGFAVVGRAKWQHNDFRAVLPDWDLDAVRKFAAKIRTLMA